MHISKAPRSLLANAFEAFASGIFGSRQSSARGVQFSRVTVQESAETVQDSAIVGEIEAPAAPIAEGDRPELAERNFALCSYRAEQNKEFRELNFEFSKSGLLPLVG